MTRAEQATANRVRVLAAAQDVFSRKGYHDASLDEIADAAGFSKGVVYSQFGSKDDLFFSVLEHRIETRARQNMEAAAGAPDREGFQAVWQLGEVIRKADQAWLLTLIEFRVHATRDPDLNKRYAELHTRTLEGIAKTLELLSERTGRVLPASASALARLSFAMANGYTLESALAPDDEMAEVTRAFAGLMTAP